MPALLRVACAAAGADEDLVRGGRRTAAESDARALLAHLACDLLLVPGSVVARATEASRQAISKARARGCGVARARGLDAVALVRASLPNAASSLCGSGLLLGPGVEDADAARSRALGERGGNDGDVSPRRVS